MRQNELWLAKHCDVGQTGQRYKLRARDFHGGLPGSIVDSISTAGIEQRRYADLFKT